MTEATTQSTLQIPGWAMDHEMYERVCRYLDLTPQPALYEKVSRYLLSAASDHPVPGGFERWLAELRPGRSSLGYLDAWTRLLMPAHPWRFRFNAVVAFHECDPRGYREMMEGLDSRLGTWLSLAGIALMHTVNLTLGVLWLGTQAGIYLIAGRGLRSERSCFEGKTVMVTGATRGLGLALTARLLSLGANVIALSRPGSALDRLNQQSAEAGYGERLRVAAVDVALPGAIEAAMDRADVDPLRLDAAIINAGVKEEIPLPYADAALRRVFDVNVFGAMQSASALLPHFLERGKGHLVFISSMGRWHGMARTGAYNASKAALGLLVESMAMDLGDAGRKSVRITSVEPGLISTGMISGGLLQKLLAISPEQAASRILRCASGASGTCRFPLLFSLMTISVAVLPASIRIKLLSRFKK
jgi:NAD(P)-dependent dehydrogenase (short-subunit alcohol dehydrogenase family)